MNRADAMAAGQEAANAKRVKELKAFDMELLLLAEQARRLKLNRRMVRGLTRLRELALLPVIQKLEDKPK